MVSLRDGRKLIGVLRSWDQFGMHPSPSSSYFKLHLSKYSTQHINKHANNGQKQT